ncbi:MAG: SpoIIE family protein phosphatase [Leptospiraceae bacterium]|nr:SpoIIE family protein phosphatase [Leptospiraceae bacterium]
MINSEIAIQKKSRFTAFEYLIGFLVILSILVMSVTAFTYSKNTDVILSLTEDLIDQINNRVIQKTTNYLFTAVDMTELSSKVAGEGKTSLIDNPSLNSVMINVLILHPQLTMFNIANERGDFLMQKRMADGTIGTKIIDRSGRKPKVTWKYRDQLGMVIKEENIQEDIDPRKYPWYIGAKEKQGLYWSDVYIFNTGKIPGITASAPVRGNNGKLMGIFGLDIPLIEISNFLEELGKEIEGKKSGKTAIAFIVNSKGDLVAYPDITQSMIKDGEDKFRSRKVSELELNPPIVQESYKYYSETKVGKFTFELEGKGYIASYRPFPDTFEKDWTIGLVVPEDDYIGAIKESNNLMLTVSVLISLSGLFVVVFLLRIKKRLDKNNILINTQKDQLEVKNSYIQKELDMGHQVQSFLIPPTELDLGWVQVSGICYNSLDLGGDFFRIYKKSEDSFSATLGDVSGKGVGSALITTAAVSLFNQAFAKNISVSDVIGEVNSNLSSMLEMKRRSKLKFFVTSAFFSIIRKKNKMEMQICNAGHLPIIIYRDNEFIQFHENSLALGIMKDSEYNAKSLELKVGDLLIIYSDGAIEQVNPNNEQFGIERLQSLISDNSQLPPKDLTEKIYSEVSKYANGEAQSDDLTLVVVKIQT